MSSTMPEDVVKLTFVISDTARHLPLHRFCGKYFNADVNDPSSIERQMFDEKIVSYKGVLTKLDFDSYTLLNMISLVVGINRLYPLILKILLLLLQ